MVVAEPVGVPGDVQDDGPVQESVQKRCGDHVVAEDLAPGCHAPVGGRDRFLLGVLRGRGLRIGDASARNAPRDSVPDLADPDPASRPVCPGDRPATALLGAGPFIGRRVRVQLGASTVTAFNGRTVIATHERLIVKGGQSLTLDHYLEVLQRKPGALPRATALVQARTAGVFAPAHEAFWAAARKTHGDGGGTRVLIEVLLLHRHLATADVIVGITAALAVGWVNPDVVAVEAPQDRPTPECGTHGAPPVSASGDAVISRTARRLAELPADPRPLPSVSQYDELLTRESS